jgi:hypothetical protein
MSSRGVRHTGSYLDADLATGERFRVVRRQLHDSEASIIWRENYDGQASLPHADFSDVYGAQLSEAGLPLKSVVDVSNLM